MEAFSAGSSPHTRGALKTVISGAGAVRIIPAYAGSTSSYPTRELPRTDHPRIRGEHNGAEVIVVEGLGSSPHTRGALVWLLADEDAVGIIPAYAGSTAARPRSSSGTWDHPRIRGEHLLW